MSYLYLPVFQSCLNYLPDSNEIEHTIQLHKEIRDISQKVLTSTYR